MIVSSVSSSVETVNVISALEIKSKEIPKIVKSINDISAKTNMLALNAAIEAVLPPVKLTKGWWLHR